MTKPSASLEMDRVEKLRNFDYRAGFLQSTISGLLYRSSSRPQLPKWARDEIRDLLDLIQKADTVEAFELTQLLDRCARSRWERKVAGADAPPKEIAHARP